MSSDTALGQTPVNGTIQVKVAPGNQTGLYYIILANLPWSTSWQQLKDHVRTICPVERVEVFNESTTGWVCVRGRENYDIALKLLSGGLFNGRPTFADGRNATQPVWIKELVGNTPVASSSPRSARVPRYTPPPPAAAYTHATTPITSPSPAGVPQWTSVSTSSMALFSESGGDYGSTPLPVTASYDYSDPGAWYSYEPLAQAYADQSAALAASFQQYSYDALYQAPPQYSAYDDVQPGGDYSPAAQGAAREQRTGKSSKQHHSSNGFVVTEKRKIIIRGLASTTTYLEVWDLVRTKAGSEADNVLHVSLPTTASEKVNKGYATVTFRSEEVANRIIKKLHGYKLHGRSLKVELTKEGVSRSEDGGRGRSSTSSQPTGKAHGGDETPRHERKESSDKKEKCQPRRDVVIANGSTRATSNMLAIRSK